ncbi:hypothetical protein J6590_027593 [Homalodisca vitripennis]|nr:hypothetical protein J6590_027593 [Homalodisca vitripennis]
MSEVVGEVNKYLLTGTLSWRVWGRRLRLDDFDCNHRPKDSDRETATERARKPGTAYLRTVVLESSAVRRFSP